MTLSERFPKWNPRYVAYALAHGATDILAFREAQPNSAEFITWIAARREAFRVEQHIKRHALTRDQERAFNGWIERKYAEPTSARTVAAEVMDEIRGLAPAETVSA